MSTPIRTLRALFPCEFRELASNFRTIRHSALPMAIWLAFGERWRNSGQCDITRSAMKMRCGWSHSISRNIIRFRRIAIGGVKDLPTGRTSLQRSQVFPYHYQPRLPADLGYYDLRIDGVQAAQVRARAKIWNFRVLLPLLLVRRNDSDDYAHRAAYTAKIQSRLLSVLGKREFGRRRWDGSEDDLLITQEHSEASDAALHRIRYSVFSAPSISRNLQVRTSSIVYRISLLSDPVRPSTFGRRVRAAGFPDYTFAWPRRSDSKTLVPYGADSSCGFPPHGTKAKALTPENGGLGTGFCWMHFDYLERSLGRSAVGIRSIYVFIRLCHRGITRAGSAWRRRSFTTRHRKCSRPGFRTLSLRQRRPSTRAPLRLHQRLE